MRVFLPLQEKIFGDINGYRVLIVQKRNLNFMQFADFFKKAIFVDLDLTISM